MRSITLNKIIFIFMILPSAWAIADSYDDLLTAVRRNDIPAMEALFAIGMDVNTTDPDANTLLILAVREDYKAMVGRLLVKHAKLGARNRYGETALMLAAAKGNLEMIKLLVQHGAEINLSGWNPLIYAAWQGKTDVVKYLLEKGADIDSVSPNGISALMMAARGGHFDTVKLLLWEVADANLRSEDGMTALTWALKGGNTDIADLLKQAGGKE